MSRLKQAIRANLLYTLGSSYTATTELIYPNGTVTSGPTLPAAAGRYGHCMVNLNDGRIGILGGRGPIDYKKVMIFNPADNTFTDGPTLLYNRYSAGCTIFHSPLHDNRPVIMIAGGLDQATAEVYDYTNGNAWEESRHICL